MLGRVDWALRVESPKAEAPRAATVPYGKEWAEFWETAWRAGDGGPATSAALKHPIDAPRFMVS